MTKKEKPFETQLAELEKIVRALDQEELALEDAVSLYERGIQLSVTLNHKLEEIQNRVEVLTKNSQGEPETQPFDEEDSQA